MSLKNQTRKESELCQGDMILTKISSGKMF